MAGSWWPYDDVGAELLGGLQPGGDRIDGDDVAGAEQAGAHDGGQADRTRPDHDDDVAGLDPAVAHSHLVAGRQDVGQHEKLFVAHTPGTG